MDRGAILSIIGENPRFSADLSGYDIIGESVSEDDKHLYFEKLRYAVKNADSLIAEAFNPKFYDFYGVDKSRTDSPDNMCGRLIFESFVLVPERGTIECCVSNPEFMPGHFIELVWNLDWNLQSVWID